MSYGRNFEFRVPPHSGQRGGRYALAASAGSLPIGCAAAINNTVNSMGLNEVALAADGTPPVPGKHGIAVFEHKNAEAFAGDDPFLTTYADKMDIPASAAVQLVSGAEVKVVLRNTSNRTFLNVRSYTGRKMVAGLGATPTVAVGDYLEPYGATASTTNGYWKETATAANAWLVVTKVDSARDEVEARLLF